MRMAATTPSPGTGVPGNRSMRAITMLSAGFRRMVSGAAMLVFLLGSACLACGHEAVKAWRGTVSPAGKALSQVLFT
ncbi:MAG: hypothetical protein OHK0024_06010 [Thalassobaculales bacterium]